MIQLEDPLLKPLKNLLRYGEQNEFYINAPKSKLYRVILQDTNVADLKTKILCIVDDKGIRLNTLYLNEVHKEEVKNWAKRLGKTLFLYEASDLDLRMLKTSRMAYPNWRLNKQPIKVPENVLVGPDLPGTRISTTQPLPVASTVNIMDYFREMVRF